MMFLRHKHSGQDMAAANSLRRYVSARAAGREAPEFARRDTVDGVSVWIECTRGETTGGLDGKHFKRVRRSGQPWCRYLGYDTSIADDLALQALFEAIEGDPHVWTALKIDVSRNRLRELRELRRRGRDILVGLRAVRQAGPDGMQPPGILFKYRQRGQGVR